MKRTVLFFLLLTAAFDFLFWQQRPGLNVFLFTILVVVLLYIRFEQSRKNIPVAILALGSLLSGFMVFHHGAGWALAANIISLLLFAAAISSTQLRSVFHFIPQSFLNLLLVPVTMGSNVARISSRESSDRRFMFYLLVVVIPLLIGAVFYAMYLWGSPHFREANSGFMEAIQNYFGDEPLLHIFFLLWAIVMSAYFLFKGFVSLPEESKIKKIIRQRKPKTGAAVMGLKRELQAGTVLLFVLNALIAVVNYIDIKTVWFDFTVPENFSLKQFVHNGTWILTVCVFMSVAIVLWLLRNNQNHFWKSWLMKLLAMVWIGQNMILAFSVLMRNYHYIGWHGLAYGRIFVIVLMLVTLIALALLMLKVSHKYTGRYFFAASSWVAYGFAIACSFVNWDRVVFEYNVKHPNVSQIDYSFYLRLSDDMMPLLLDHYNEIENQIAAHATNKQVWCYGTSAGFWSDVKYKGSRHFRDIVFSDWQSITVADESAFSALRAMNRK